MYRIIFHPAATKATTLLTNRHRCWSSYRATAGMEDKADFPTISWILPLFSGGFSQSQHAYRRFVVDGITGLESPWQKVSGQVFLGRQRFSEWGAWHHRG